MNAGRKVDWRNPETWEACVRKEPSGCWVWTRTLDRFGYGKVLVTVQGKQYMWLAHRLAFQGLVGPLPDRQQVLHRCDNPPCVNPEHLFLGTPYVNAIDRTVKGRTPRGEAHYAAKLNEVAVRVIRYFLAKGYSQKRIAEAYGIHQRLVSAINVRHTWKHVA